MRTDRCEAKGRWTSVWAIALTAFAATATPGWADGPLTLELNRLDSVEGACRLTFLAENGSGTDIVSLALETVLIDTDGVVDRLTLFEFGELPAGVPRVRQFDLSDLACADLGRVLVNGVAGCDGPDDCGNDLNLLTRTDVELIG